MLCTVPRPGDISTDVAFDTFQQSCAVPPGLTFVGETVKLWTAGTVLPVTVTTTWAVTVVFPSAPVVAHERLADWPAVMVAGAAWKRTMDGVDEPTVTVRFWVTCWPPGPVAVKG